MLFGVAIIVTNHSLPAKLEDGKILSDKHCEEKTGMSWSRATNL